MANFDGFERSEFFGRDIRLYEFTRGTMTWRYNSGDRNVTYAGQNYAQLTIKDSGIKQKGEAVTDDFTITLPYSTPIALAFRGTPPSGLIKVAMRQMQYGDTEAPLMWVGYLSSVKFVDAVSAQMICNTQAAFLARKGLRLAYERNCPHVLYDDDCRLNKADWAEGGTIRDLTGNSFNFDLTFPNPLGYAGRFSNGFIEWQPDPNWFERRAIQVHSGDLCILLNNTDGLSVGMRVTFYPGCARTPTNCRLFNNISNYGGFPFMPGVSPFDGNPVF